LRRGFRECGDREREAADRRHGLAELVVQLVRDQPALLLDPLLDQPAELAALLESRLRLARLALGGDLVLDGLRHRIERLADRARLGARERRQAEAEIPAADPREPVDDDRD